MNRQEQEFREFVRERAPLLHRSAYLLCGDWHLANDLVQEALAKTYRNWARVQRADSPDAYVRRIVVNEAHRHWRRHKHTAPGDHGHLAEETASSDSADEIVRRAGLLQALLSLPPRQRATVVLRYLEGLTERETAAVLQCSEGTVKSQTSRALSALRTYLEREESTL
ncbi:MAG TPA: SigE family RNA polymerase sigma factor [Acidimicrobiales bacterium]|jgi:RNA polymerase sigma-70 factor (sigma-E family)|nr:SigE family RNA polymerase sigma factor [Acidimicrobiales bacterium]